MINIGAIFKFFLEEIRGFLVFFRLLFFFSQEFKMLNLKISLFKCFNKFGLRVVRVFRIDVFLFTLYSNLALKEFPLRLAFLTLLIGI